MSKLARTDHPIHPPLASRWSPYGYADKAVTDSDLRSLLEAARWAASAFNEQPWHYIVGTRNHSEAHEQVLSCLVEANQAWAKAAPVLLLAVIAENYERNGKPNSSALHDLGLASANLTVEAAVRGLSVHQMAGILPDRAREVFGIPAGFRAVTGLAIGYAQDPGRLDEELRARDTSPRTRKPLAEFVFSGSWGTPSSILED